MKDTQKGALAELADLDWTDWCLMLDQIADEDGYCDPLGPSHAALFIEKKPTLLVTFESFASMHSADRSGQPMAWPLTDALDWSHLALFSNGDTWFRDPHVYAFFDRLIDDGFFDEFDQVLFYGAGASGYAACAFSVAAPGARVLALQPQATLDPRVTEWDDRFTQHRRRDFTSRFGYAPDMLQAADHAWIAYNPGDPLDAMHASLFTSDTVTKIRARHLGDALEPALMRINVLFRMLAQMSSGKLTDLSLARLMRARRTDRGYLSNLMLSLESKEQFTRARQMCRAVLRDQELRPIRRGLIRVNRALGLDDA